MIALVGTADASFVWSAAGGLGHWDLLVIWYLMLGILMIFTLPNFTNAICLENTLTLF